jgi:hypothetical protein
MDPFLFQSNFLKVKTLGINFLQKSLMNPSTTQYQLNSFQTITTLVAWLTWELLITK